MDNWRETRWVVVGSGRLGSLLVLMAKHAGVRSVASWSRTKAPYEAADVPINGDLEAVWSHCDDALVWLAVSDDAVAEVARSLAVSGARPAGVLHGSGSRSSTVLADAGIEQPVGSLHPLLSIADPLEALGRVGEVTWSFEGAAKLQPMATEFLGVFENEPLILEADQKVLYHASAVAASGLVTATIDVALGLAEEAGIDRERARDMLLPLVESTVSNLRQRSTSAALTGPVAREDAETVRAHIRALEGLGDADVAAVYRLLSRRLASSEFRTKSDLDD